MARVKRGTTALKRRHNVLAQTKGYNFGRSTKERQAREAIFHAGTYAFAHRRDKKNDFRKLWNVRINAAIRPLELSYSKFIHLLKVKEIGLDRKVLSAIAQTRPEAFKRIVEKAR